MSKNNILSYTEQRAREVTLLTRELLQKLPLVCADFLRAIEPTTQPLTRYAYARDLSLLRFCPMKFLASAESPLGILQRKISIP